MKPLAPPASAWRRYRLRIALALAAAMLASLAQAAGTAADEYALKAAYLFHFTRFVEWPATAFEGDTSAFRICVLGVDPFGRRLDAIARRKVGQRPIEIRRPTTAEGMARCHIAYLADGSGRNRLAATIGPQPPATLTVASDAAFASDGGMVALVTRGGRVHLHVNLASIRASPLRFSAKLLEVADVRHGEAAR